MRNVETLRAACDDILRDKNLKPVKDSEGNIVKTFCNEGAMYVARSMGCYELDSLMADDQYKVMSKNVSKRWAKVAGMTSAAHANFGGLAFAAMTSEMLKEFHGHIAAIYPAPMEFSESLQKAVPVVANVGKSNLKEKESMAFPVAQGEPDYFIYD